MNQVAELPKTVEQQVRNQVFHARRLVLDVHLPIVANRGPDADPDSVVHDRGRAGIARL